MIENKMQPHIPAGLESVYASNQKCKTEKRKNRKRKTSLADCDGDMTTWKCIRRSEQLKQQDELESIKRSRQVENRMKQVNAMEELIDLEHRLNVVRRIRDDCRRQVRSNGRYACDVRALKSSVEMVRELERQVRALPERRVTSNARRVRNQGGSGHTSMGYDILKPVGSRYCGGSLSM